MQIIVLVFDLKYQSADLTVGHNRTEMGTYLIFVIFFTQAKFLENKIYTEKRQILPIFRQFTPKFTQ